MYIWNLCIYVNIPQTRRGCPIVAMCQFRALQNCRLAVFHGQTMRYTTIPRHNHKWTPGRQKLL